MSVLLSTVFFLTLFLFCEVLCSVPFTCPFLATRVRWITMSMETCERITLSNSPALPAAGRRPGFPPACLCLGSGLQGECGFGGGSRSLAVCVYLNELSDRVASTLLASRRSWNKLLGNRFPDRDGTWALPSMQLRAVTAWTLSE